MKIYFILHLPPPVHGASMMGKYIHDSHVVNNAYDCKYFNLTLAKDLQDIGKGGLRKLIDFIKQITALHKVIKAENPNLCYVTPNAKGGAYGAQNEVYNDDWVKSGLIVLCFS
jgi:hypothetical protein|nr:MAG TPA: hypothetical protein [Caudoviricetes sp.]